MGERARQKTDRSNWRGCLRPDETFEEFRFSAWPDEDPVRTLVAAAVVLEPYAGDAELAGALRDHFLAAADDLEQSLREMYEDGVGGVVPEAAPSLLLLARVVVEEARP